MLIAGDPRSGKSWVTGLACEQLILQGYSVFVIDPEGDYRTLEWLPGVVVFGGDDPPPELPVLARVLRHPDMSVVMDLSHAPYQEKVNYLKSLLPMLAAIRRATGLPHRIVIDEAHYFLHEPNVNELLDLTLGAYTLVTYRMSDLHPNLRRAMEGVIIKRTTEPREIQALTDILAARGTGAESIAVLSSLGMEEAVLLPGIEESGNRLLKFKLFPRLTSHVRHKAKYLDVQLLAEQGFWFTDKEAVARWTGANAEGIRGAIGQGPRLSGRGTRPSRRFLQLDRRRVPRSCPGVRYPQGRTTLSHRPHSRSLRLHREIDPGKIRIFRGTTSRTRR